MTNRYRIRMVENCIGNPSPSLEKADDGDLVKFSDYAALEQKHERLAAALRSEYLRIQRPPGPFVPGNGTMKCRRCGGTWAENAPEQHGSDCPLASTPAPKEDGLVECKLCGERHGCDFCPTLRIELHTDTPAPDGDGAT